MTQTFMRFDVLGEVHSFFWKEADGLWKMLDAAVPPDAFLRCAETDSLIVLLPAECVVLRQVVMPQLSVNELRQALPFALEEELIDELTDLHFACSLQSHELAAPVAVIARPHMNTCLQYFKKYQLPVSMVTSELFLLPIRSSSCTLLLNDQRYLLRAGTFLGFGGNLRELPSFFDVFQNETSSNTHYDVYSYTTSPPVLPFRKHTLCDTSSTEHWLIDRLQFLSRDDWDNAINLLQGDYTYRMRSSFYKNRWRYLSLACLAGALFIFMFYPLISSYFLSTRIAEVRLQTEKAYRAIFPDAKSVIAPRIRIEEKLAAYSSVTQRESFLVLLSKMADAKREVTGVRWLKLDYQEHRMQLGVMAENASELNAFVERLKQAGLTVKEQNTTVDGIKIKTTLELSSS